MTMTRGPVYRRTKGKGRNATREEWVAGFQTGNVLRVLALGDATGDDAITGDEAEQLAEAVLLGGIPTAPATVGATDAMAALTAEVLTK